MSSRMNRALPVITVSPLLQLRLSGARLFPAAASSLKKSLLKNSAQEHFFKASLGHMSPAWLSVAEYEEQSPSFEESREAKLIKAFDAVAAEFETGGQEEEEKGRGQSRKSYRIRGEIKCF